MINWLEQKRLLYQPPIPTLLDDLSRVTLRAQGGKATVVDALRKKFPHTHGLLPSIIERMGEEKKYEKLTVGVLFSGGQASGGHNVLTGLFDGLKQIHPESQLIGFLDGPAGLIENRSKRLEQTAIDRVRNQGGFDLIGTSRIKVETADQFQAVLRTVKEHKLQTLVIIGGDDSNTNAAFLAEYFLEQNVGTCVIGVPKTIDGDLRSHDIELSFGFDSACKTYAELIGNIARDTLAAKKYYHFIKLMGRSASHITLECALATCPNLALIGEEKASLAEIVADIADLIVERKKAGKEFGVLLIPEGVIEFAPESKAMIGELNRLLGQLGTPEKVLETLADPHRSLFFSLPEKIRKQLLLERDPHGNIQVSQIETEQLIFDLVKQELQKRNCKFNALQHFFGYEGRSCFPSNFDANYGYALGRFASLAARERITGAILAMKHLARPASEWEPKAVPLVQLLHLEMRKGAEKYVIAKALVDLKGQPFSLFARERKKWRLGDLYRMPGPIQFFGDKELTDAPPISIS